MGVSIGPAMHRRRASRLVLPAGAPSAREFVLVFSYSSMSFNSARISSMKPRSFATKAATLSVRFVRPGSTTSSA